ncbi:glycosyltransferase, group 1 family protein, putative [Heliomicrobium modesticaldum Ice1]|uniref:Glycosyltransferase, group 1 family protein, putative n=1 Tax=Heliobacterium modesticaldum (strain ATCC 51547 / Ice1) TaxID=498761 RepID=B0THF7_HELMI|nr:glycosyltransferase [Heliomicrobium modesticaldum]ABZ83395.1 glycosyltransferase, group 1 family protein, putative [Heliomicrobium modesticaldum Ice1]
MSRPIRVLHIIGGGEIGGAEIHILDLARFFSPQEVELHLCCLFPAPLLQRALKQGVQATAVPMRSKADLAGFWKVFRLIRQLQPAIVHTHGVRANLVGRLAAKLAGVRCIVTTVHSVLENDYPDRVARWINYWSEKITAPLTERTIVVADFLKKRLCAQGMAAAKVSVIHNGVDDEKFVNAERNRDVRVEFGIAADAPLIGMVGRFHPVKGHKYLVEAAKEILKINSHIRFLLVGDGFYRNVIETVIREEGLESFFLFTGFREDIADIYRALDVLALPSLSEGLSLTLMEGMLCECPAVVTAVGGNPEIVANEKNGLVIPPGDALALAAALLRLIENREEARRFGEAARKTIEERFTAKRMAEKTQNLYRELVDGPE